ncbi:hypothetical protein F511_38487 [Dorcoceras hygrometricum]|uniref:Uncharacterized protein n=1 Tax=Dorcoceras hygrometricum TaxID=472368 RepID=A0A2Z7CIJ7_9LAMI|nr:hypothetical protein F511_38487 [Dorcoceras hygrometricum]
MVRSRLAMIESKGPKRLNEGMVVSLDREKLSGLKAVPYLFQFGVWAQTVDLHMLCSSYMSLFSSLVGSSSYPIELDDAKTEAEGHDLCVDGSSVGTSPATLRFSPTMRRERV